MIKLSNFLLEYTILPYKKTPWYHSGDSIGTEYEFKTKSGQFYEVSLGIINNQSTLSIDFFIEVETKQGPKLSNSEISNKGDLYDLLATIMDIIKKAIKKYPKIKYIEYIPEKSKKEKNYAGNKRDIAYRYFLKKEFPNTEFSSNGKKVVAKIN